MARDRLLTPPFVLCSAANLAQGLAFNLYLHLPGFLKELGAEEVKIGFIFGVTAIASILARPALGRAMDRRGRRVVILAGGLLNVLVCALYLTVETVGVWVGVVRVLHGLAEAMLFTGLFTYAADCVPGTRRTEGLALFGVSGMLPISLGGVLGDLILRNGTYGHLFLASLGFAALSLALSLPLHDLPRGSEEEVPSRSFAVAVVQRDLLPLWFLGTAFSIALTAAFTFLKTYVMETGLGSVGLFFSTYAGAAIVLRVFFGWLPDRVGPKRVLYPSLATLGLGFLVLASAHSARAVGVAGLLCGAGHGYTFPILFALVVTRARASERGAAMSVFTALFDAGVLIGGPSLGGVVRLAGYPAMFRSAAALLGLGMLGFVFWERRLLRNPRPDRSLR